MPIKISQLANAYPLTGGEELPVNKAGTDGKITPRQILHWGDGARAATVTGTATLEPEVRRIRWTGSGSAILTLPAIGAGETQVPAGSVLEVLGDGSAGPLTIQGSDSATVATVEDGEFWRLQAVAAPADWQATQFMLEGDPRLSDARAPTAHTHEISEIGGLFTELNSRAYTNGGNITDPETWRVELGVISDAETWDRVNGRAGMTGRRYFGGKTDLPADPRINGQLTYGGEYIVIACPFSQGPSNHGRLIDGRTSGHFFGVRDQTDGKLRLAFTVTTTGTPIQVTSNLALAPVGRFSAFRAKFNGSISAPEIELWHNDVKHAITISPGTGTVSADDSVKSIGGNPLGANLFDGVISRVIPLNYTLTDAEWFTFLRTGNLPTQDAGSMVNGFAGISFGANRTATNGSGSISGATGWTIYTQSSFNYTIETNNGVAGALRASATAFGDKLTPSPSVKSLRLGMRYRLRFRYYLPSASTLTELAIKQDNNNVKATIARANLTTNAWTHIEMTFTATATTTWTDTIGIGWTVGAELVVAPDWKIYELGNLLPGLDLGEQPVIARTTNNIVALDSGTGVSIFPERKPERMVLTSQAPMTADGFFLADQQVIPAGYMIADIFITNVSGPDLSGVTLKYDSSAGVTIGTYAGTIVSTGTVRMTIANAVHAESAARKVHVSGLSGKGNTITITAHLVRMK